MRLICPNCDAQYEIPDNVLPSEGRDVQCSNCGDTWFQEHPDYPDGAEPEFGLDIADENGASEPEKQNEVGPRPAAPEAPVDQSPSKRRELNPSVADVLRAEAALEANARVREKENFETQPDLGLTETFDDRQKQAKKLRDVRSDMQDAPAKVAPTGKAMTAGTSSRRDLLPDIEEINSTLRSNNNRIAEQDPGQTAQVEIQEKHNSRHGFIFAVFLVGLAAITYVSSAELAEAVPQAAPALEIYVAWVNALRLWLDTKLAAGLGWLDDMTR